MKYRFSLIIILCLLIFTDNFLARAQADALAVTILRSFDKSSTIDERTAALKELLEYTKQTPKVLDATTLQKI
ncbi:MAG: hypothetical protein AABY86_06300, partial [Bdellovibrionota bacterium]